MATREQEENYYRVAEFESAQGYQHFLQYVTVDCRPQKLPLRRVAEPWQMDRATRSARAINSVAGLDPSYQGVRSFWEEFHKGSDKTHDNARELCYLLSFTTTRLMCYVCAGSEDQAALITAAMMGILADNPFLVNRMEVSKLTAQGQHGSTLTVMPLNAFTGQGIFPDYLIASEVTHWQHEEGRIFWEFILESVGKRAHCVLKVETNAGVRGSWQWKERERIRLNSLNPDPEKCFWSFYSAPVGQPLPTWMNQNRIDEDSQGLTPGERDRLYRNRWIDPGEEHGYLTLADAMSCRHPQLFERVHGQAYTEYTVVIDYGGVFDRCALSIQHCQPGLEQLEVDRLDCWQGTRDDRVDILYDPVFPTRRSVQKWIDLVLKKFRIGALVMDPYQLEALAIYYERRGIRVIRIEYKAGKTNYRMCQLLKTAVMSRAVFWSSTAGLLPATYHENGRVHRIEDRTLEEELSMLVTRRMSYGYRFDHESGRHDDRATVIAAGLCHLFPEGSPPSWQGPQTLEDDRETPVLGSERTIHQGELNESVQRWGLFGASQGGGSAWDRGDID